MAIVLELLLDFGVPFLRSCAWLGCGPKLIVELGLNSQHQGLIVWASNITWLRTTCSLFNLVPKAWRMGVSTFLWRVGKFMPTFFLLNIYWWVTFGYWDDTSILFNFSANEKTLPCPSTFHFRLFTNSSVLSIFSCAQLNDSLIPARPVKLSPISSPIAIGAYFRWALRMHL